MDRDEALRLLGGGSQGVREWNRRRAAVEEIPHLSDLSESDLAGADLCRAEILGDGPRGRGEPPPLPTMQVVAIDLCPLPPHARERGGGWCRVGEIWNVQILVS